MMFVGRGGKVLPQPNSPLSVLTMGGRERKKNGEGKGERGPFHPNSLAGGERKKLVRINYSCQ